MIRLKNFLFLLLVISVILLFLAGNVTAQDYGYIPMGLVKKYIHLLETNPDNFIRAESAFYLGRMRSYKALDVLIEKLNDPNEAINVRSVCAYALSKLPDDKSIEALSNIIKAEEVKGLIRRSAMYSLYWLDWENQQAIFLNFLSDENTLIRSTSADILSNYSRKSVSQAIIDALRKEDNPNVRVALIKASSKLGDPSHIDYLNTLLNDTDEDLIKILCSFAIAKISYANNLSNVDTYLDIIRVFKEKHGIYSLGSLVALNDRTVLQDLFNIYRNGITTQEEKLMVEFFSRSSFDEPFEELMDIISSEDKTYNELFKFQSKRLGEGGDDISKLRTNYELIIFIERNLLNVDISNLIDSMHKFEKYNDLLSKLLYIKIDTNPVLLRPTLLDYLSNSNILYHKPIIKTLLKLDEAKNLNLLVPLLQFQSQVLKINSLFILAETKTNRAFEIIESELDNASDDFVIRALKKLEYSYNYKLPGLFIEYLSKSSYKLRNQALISMRNSIGVLLDHIGDQFYESIGELLPEKEIKAEIFEKYILPKAIDEEEKKLLNDSYINYKYKNVYILKDELADNTKQKICDLFKKISYYNNNIFYLGFYSLRPFYKLFKQDLAFERAFLDSEIGIKLPDYSAKLEKIRRANPYLFKSVNEEVNILLDGIGITVLNNYRITLYYDEEVYNRLFRIVILPVINKVFRSRTDKKRLIMMFVPTLSRVDNDIDSADEVRGLIFNQMEKSDDSEILIKTAANLVYTFRTLKKPLETYELKTFRKILSRRIIKLAEYIKSYRDLKGSKITNSDLSLMEINLIVNELHRALAEAIIVDKELYLQIISYDIDNEIKLILINKLEIISDYDDVKTLLITLVGHESELVREYSLSILSESMEETHIESLFIDRLDDENENVRKVAINELVKVGKKIIYPIIDNLFSEDELLKDSVSEVLIKLGDESVYILSKYLNNDNTSTEGKKRIIEVLGEIDTPYSIDVLSDYQNFSSNEIKRMIASILMHSENTEDDIDRVINAIEVLDDEDLVMMYEKDKEKETILSFTLDLIESLTTTEQEILTRIKNSLIRLGKLNIDLLINNLNNTNYKIRKGLEDVLVSIGKDLTYDKLIEALDSDNIHIYNSSVMILSRFGESVISDLISLIKSDNINIRYGVVNVLSKIKHVKALYPLLKMYNDDNVKIVVIVKRSLGNNFDLSKRDMVKLYNLSEEEWKKFQDMTLEEIREKYL